MNYQTICCILSIHPLYLIVSKLWDTLFDRKSILTPGTLANKKWLLNHLQKFFFPSQLLILLKAEFTAVEGCWSTASRGSPDPPQSSALSSWLKKEWRRNRRWKQFDQKGKYSLIKVMDERRENRDSKRWSRAIENLERRTAWQRMTDEVAGANFVKTRIMQSNRSASEKSNDRFDESMLLFLPIHFAVGRGYIGQIDAWPISRPTLLPSG